MTDVNQINRKRHSIRDVRIDRPRKSARSSVGHGGNGARYPSDGDGMIDNHDRVIGIHAKRGIKMGWWVLAALLLVSASVISLPIVFSDTTINIKPVITRSDFTDALFNAFKENDISVAEDSDILTYSVVEWETTLSEALEPTGRERVKEKASGIITVYNEYTSNTQRLIKNTRFETDDGRIYRVRESIMVPGKTGSTPGTLDVRVYADEAGERYNLESGNFTLPGLKSLPDMYTNIYAKVKTPITGGFDGERAVVSKEAKEKASKKLREKINEIIKDEISSRIPEDTYFFESGVTIDFADTSENEVDGKLVITETASVRVIVFNKDNFARTLAQGGLGNPSGGNPVIKDVNTLDVSIDTAPDITVDGESIRVIVNGEASFVWHFNEDDLKRDLAGREREALKTILAGYPTIQSAEAIIRPFWRSTFPKNVHDFTIKIMDTE